MSKLRSAHPDYLKLDGQNDDLIKRFTKVFDKVAPKFSEKFRLKKYAFIDDPKDEYFFLNQHIRTKYQGNQTSQNQNQNKMSLMS